MQTWGELPGSGPLPRGEEAIAKMRLFLQAQTPEKQQAVACAFDDLGSADRSVLVEELARTGIVDQVFRRGPSWRQSFGPAFLVYYSPAFLRSLSPYDAYPALQILAEVYRRGASHTATHAAHRHERSPSRTAPVPLFAQYAECARAYAMRWASAHVCHACSLAPPQHVICGRCGHRTTTRTV